MSQLETSAEAADRNGIMSPNMKNIANTQVYQHKLILIQIQAIQRYFRKL